MLWRLILFVIAFALLLIFITFNLENRCDINFWKGKGFTDVPVFVSVFFSFFLGFLCSLPFIIKARMKKPKKDEPHHPAGELPKNSKNKSSKDDNFKDNILKEGSDAKG
jgi:uncharacterized integral membrane protein